MKGRMKLKTRYKVLLIAAAIVIVLVSAAAYVTLSKTRAMINFRYDVLWYTPWRHVIEHTSYEYNVPWWTPWGLSVENRPYSEKSWETRWALTATFHDITNEERLYKNLDWLFSHIGEEPKRGVKGTIDIYLRNSGAVMDTNLNWYNRGILISIDRDKETITVSFSWEFMI